MENEKKVDGLFIEEVAGKMPPGIPMTEEQAYYLHDVIDPKIDLLIEGIELEKVRRRLADEYQKRTIPELRKLP